MEVSRRAPQCGSECHNPERDNHIHGSGNPISDYDFPISENSHSPILGARTLNARASHWSRLHHNASLFGGGETGTTQGRATGLFPYALTASDYTNLLTESDGVATFTLLKCGSSALSIVSSSQTGYIIDTDTVHFDVGDTCANQIAVAETGGSVTWASAALLLEAG